MRQDQWEAMQALEEKLIDIFLAEADPSMWPMAGTPSANLSAEDRKQRYLFKRAASETAHLLGRTRNLIDSVQGLGTTSGDAGDDEEEREAALSTEMRVSEREAENLRRQLLDRVQRGSKTPG